MSRPIVLVLFVLVVACGGSSSTRDARARADVVTAEWTGGDDAPLTRAPSTTSR